MHQTHAWQPGGRLAASTGAPSEEHESSVVGCGNNRHTSRTVVKVRGQLRLPRNAGASGGCMRACTATRGRVAACASCLRVQATPAVLQVCKGPCVAATGSGREVGGGRRRQAGRGIGLAWRPGRWPRQFDVPCCAVARLARAMGRSRPRHGDLSRLGQWLHYGGWAPPGGLTACISQQGATHRKAGRPTRSPAAPPAAPASLTAPAGPSSLPCNPRSLYTPSAAPSVDAGALTLAGPRQGSLAAARSPQVCCWQLCK